MTRQSSTLNTAIMLQQALEAPEGTVTIAINGREPGPHYPQDPHASELTRKGFLRLRVQAPMPSTRPYRSTRSRIRAAPRCAGDCWSGISPEPITARRPFRGQFRRRAPPSPASPWHPGDAVRRPPAQPWQHANRICGCPGWLPAVPPPAAPDDSSRRSVFRAGRIGPVQEGAGSEIGIVDSRLVDEPGDLVQRPHVERSRRERHEIEVAYRQRATLAVHVAAPTSITTSWYFGVSRRISVTTARPGQRNARIAGPDPAGSCCAYW